MLCCILRSAAYIVAEVPMLLSLLVDSPYVGSSGAALPSLVQQADSPQKGTRHREQKVLLCSPFSSQKMAACVF